MSSAVLPTVADEEIDNMPLPTDRSREASAFEPSRYFAQAIRAIEGGYTAQYGAPGLLPSRLKDDAGRVMIFQTAAKAELAAARALIDVLTSRSRHLRQGSLESYRKMTGAELADELAEIGVTPTLLAYLVGTSPSRVLKWLEDPDEDVPHQVRLLLALFKADPKNIDRAEAATEQVATRKAPPRKDDG